MPKEQDNTLFLLSGIILAVGLGYIFWRLYELSKENNELNQKVRTLEGNLTSFSHYIHYLSNKITYLEKEKTNLHSKYQNLLEEIHQVKQQIPNEEGRQLLNQLIEAVRKRRFERTRNLGFYN
jgi:peptidoglycan hydrolase CwlO-like protein